MKHVEGVSNVAVDAFSRSFMEKHEWILQYLNPDMKVEIVVFHEVFMVAGFQELARMGSGEASLFVILLPDTIFSLKILRHALKIRIIVRGTHT